MPRTSSDATRNVTLTLSIYKMVLKQGDINFNRYHNNLYLLKQHLSNWSQCKNSELSMIYR